MCGIFIVLKYFKSECGKNLRIWYYVLVAFLFLKVIISVSCFMLVSKGKVYGYNRLKLFVFYVFSPIYLIMMVVGNYFYYSDRIECTAELQEEKDYYSHLDGLVLVILLFGYLEMFVFLCEGCLERRTR